MDELKWTHKQFLRFEIRSPNSNKIIFIIKANSEICNPSRQTKYTYPVVAFLLFLVFFVQASSSSVTVLLRLGWGNWCSWGRLVLVNSTRHIPLQLIDLQWNRLPKQLDRQIRHSLAKRRGNPCLSACAVSGFFFSSVFLGIGRGGREEERKSLKVICLLVASN